MSKLPMCLALRGLIAVVLMASPVFSAEWIGAGQSDRWSDAGNWAHGAVPGPGDEARFAGGGGKAAGNDLAAVRVVVVEGDWTLSGDLLSAESVEVRSGALILDLPLRTGRLRVAAGARAEVRAALTMAGDQLEVAAAGTLRFLAPIHGAGGVAISGGGEVTLDAISDYAGSTTVSGGVLRLAADAPAVGPGSLGAGGSPLRLSNTTLVQATVVVARPLAVAVGGARLRAEGAARTLAAPLALAPWGGSSLSGTYFPGSRRGLISDDWRVPGEGTVRVDAMIAFQGAFGTPAERQRMGIAGRDGDWDDFSVQWDGWLRVEVDDVALVTASDDGSRLWLDRDGDGEIDPEEWGGNGWGQGQGTTARVVHPGLARGIYRFRAQFEEGYGGNAMYLLWSDAQRSQVEVAGYHLVPAEAFVRPLQISVVGDQSLTLAGPVAGTGLLCLQATAPTVLATPWPGAIEVLAGARLICAAAGMLDAATVTIGSDAQLDQAGHGQRPQALSGGGTLVLGGAALDIDASGDQRFTPLLRGPGTLRKRGPGTLQLAGSLDPTLLTVVEAGALAFVDGRQIAVVPLGAPLTTRLFLHGDRPGDRRISATVEVPADAPPGLGIGAFACDRHGRWYQRLHPQPLTPGIHEVSFVLAADTPLSGEPVAMAWDAAAARQCDRSGLFWWGGAKGGTLRIDARVQALAGPPPGPAARLADLTAPTAARTGERWELTCRPQPFPADPYDAAAFALDAVVTAPDGSVRRLPGFYTEPMRGVDRGDREEVTPTGRGTFAVRWRPAVPGRHRVRLEARWAGGRTVTAEVDPVEVAGPPWDGYVRVDANDPRFFSVAGDFFWPIGINIRSVTDSRCAEAMGTASTPLRGSLAYDSYLARFAAAGGTAVEIWLAAWNLGLEWRADWEGFHGVGNYHQGHAWQLDRVLDAAWSRGVRVNLVINNHGQGSDSTDREWENSPYNRVNGGRLDTPSELFHDPWALAGQERMRRYLIARYADHPAILGWKLWSEVDLTAARGLSPAWHQQAAARWRALDAYGHPCTSHWSGDWRSVDPGVAQIADIGYLCIDAYHGDETSIADLLWRSTQGLLHYRKPILVTEYGGGWGGTSPAQMVAALASAGWVGLVSGHAGAPMLWWWEWVDQGERWAPYRAIATFARGEDLRGRGGQCRVISATGPRGPLWCRAWSRPGRMLGYCCDPTWVRRGVDGGTLSGARIQVGEVGAGTMTIEWWDADVGTVLARQRLDHTGGSLTLTPPAFSRHLGFKLVRE